MIRTTSSTTLLTLLAVVMMVMFSGCASSYNDYQTSCIPYRYCKPSPLPNVSHKGCHCPTYGSTSPMQQNTSETILIDSEVPTEAPEVIEDDSPPIAPVPQ